MNYLMSRAHDDITNDDFIMPFIYAFVHLPAGNGRSFVMATFHCIRPFVLFSTLCSQGGASLTQNCRCSTIQYLSEHFDHTIYDLII